MGKHGYNHGDIGWCQLNTTDADAAVKFYTELLGGSATKVHFRITTS